MRQASVKDTNSLQDTQNSKTGNPNTVTLSDSKLEPEGQVSGGQIFQTQNIYATKQPFSKQNLISQPELTKEVVKLLDSQIDQQPEKQATDIMPVQQKLASSKTFEQKAEESVYKRKEDKAVSSREINEKQFTKMLKLFVNMRKTLIPIVNKILKRLKVSDNPEGDLDQN